MYQHVLIGDIGWPVSIPIGHNDCGRPDQAPAPVLDKAELPDSTSYDDASYDINDLPHDSSSDGASLDRSQTNLVSRTRRSLAYLVFRMGRWRGTTSGVFTVWSHWPSYVFKGEGQLAR